MTDDLTKRGPRDRARINIHEPYELEYWAKKFGITEKKLKSIVQKVGPMVKDVQKELKG